MNQQTISALTHDWGSLTVEMNTDQCINQLHMQCNYNCDKGYRMLKVMLPLDLVSKVKDTLLTICKRQNYGGKTEQISGCQGCGWSAEFST